MRTRTQKVKTNPVEVFAGRVNQVRDWRKAKKVKMDCKGVRRCARELGLSSAMVKDALNVLARRAKADSKVAGAGVQS